MRRSRVVTPVALAIGLALTSACGGDDGGGLTDDQATAVDQLLESAAADDIDVDRSCVEDLAAGLSDEDAAAIVAAGPDGDPELSADGEALTARLFGCVDIDSLADSVIDELTASGTPVDEDCVRDALRDLDPEALAASGDDAASQELFGALMACVDLGS